MSPSTPIHEPGEPPLRPAGRFEWERVLRRAEIPGRTKFLALVLSTYADQDGTRVRPGLSVLAADTGFGERSVRRELAVLRDDLGLIEQTSRGGGRGGRGKATEFRLVFPRDLLDRVNLRPPTESPATQAAGQSPESPATSGPGQSRPQPVDNSESPATQKAAQSPDVPSEHPKSPAGALAPENDFHRPDNTVTDRMTGQTEPNDRPQLWPATKSLKPTTKDQPPTGHPAQPPTARDLDARTRVRLAAIANCALCDPQGYAGRVLCDHDPTAPDRAAKGLAAIRAALPAGRGATRRRATAGKPGLGRLDFTPTTRREPPPTEDPP